MYRIDESIEIFSPPEKVLALVSDAESRMRLNPSCQMVGCEQLDRPEADGGTAFRFFLEADGKRFKCDVVQVLERNRIISRALDGSHSVALSVTPTPRGTRLRHEEDFVLPDEMLEPRTKLAEADRFRSFRQILRMFFAFDYFEAEKTGKADAVIHSLRQALQTWLLRIKEKIEKEN